MFNFEDKVVVITGAAQGIGKCIRESFKKAGAKVAVIDVQENEYFRGDLSEKEVLEKFAEKVIEDYGHVDYLINNAAPLFKGISECTYEEFLYAQKVGVAAPFYVDRVTGLCAFLYSFYFS